MSRGNESLTICLLILPVLTFIVNGHEVQALRPFVDDEDEAQDFDFAITAINSSNLGNASAVKHLILEKTKNYENEGYADIKNVKLFYYNSNGTIAAEIVTGKSGNYNFSDRTTYGVAINLNPFLNPVNPGMQEADYIYRFIFNNKTGNWSRYLAIEHNQGEEKILSGPRASAGPILNKTEHYVRMFIDLSKIGAPEKFQVKFFASTIINTVTNGSYFLTDDTPWIEVPQPVISLSVEPEISEIYPDQNKTVKINVKSTSNISQTVKLCSDKTLLLNCQDPKDCSNFCWNFLNTSTVVVGPPTNFNTVPAKFVSKTIGNEGDIMYTNLYYSSYPTDTSVGTPHPSAFKVRLIVGNYWTDVRNSIFEFPVKYPYVPTAIFLVAGFTVHRIGFTRIKGIFKRSDKNWTNDALKLLKSGDVIEFNERRRKYPSHLDLQATDLSYTNLQGADLRGTKLSRANLVRANLSGTNLARADLSNTILIGINHFTNLNINKTKFNNAIIDKAEFFHYLKDEKNNSQDVPERLKTKRDLKTRLEQRGYKKEIIDNLLSVSDLPE